MDEMIKELVAVGAAVTANCSPCLNYHYRKALDLGASNDEIKEAVEVGRMVRRGAARSWDKEADKIFGIEQEGKK